MQIRKRNQYLARSGSARAEQRLKELHIELPEPPAPFGTYVEAVQTGNLLFLTGMLWTDVLHIEDMSCSKSSIRSLLPQP